MLKNSLIIKFSIPISACDIMQLENKIKENITSKMKLLTEEIKFTSFIATAEYNERISLNLHGMIYFVVSYDEILISGELAEDVIWLYNIINNIILKEGVNNV